MKVKETPPPGWVTLGGAEGAVGGQGGASVGEDLSAVVFGGPSCLLRHNRELRAEWKHAEREAFIWHWRVDRALARLALLHRPDMVARETGGKGAEGGVGVSQWGGAGLGGCGCDGERGEWGKDHPFIKDFSSPSASFFFFFFFSIRCSNTHTHMHARTYTQTSECLSCSHLRQVLVSEELQARAFVRKKNSGPFFFFFRSNVQLSIDTNS